MKTRVTMSGVGEVRIRATCSYDGCAMKRNAMYSCLSKLHNQYLRSPEKKRTKKGFREIIGLGPSGRREGAYVMKEVRASVCSVSALSAASR